MADTFGRGRPTRQHSVGVCPTGVREPPAEPCEGVPRRGLGYHGALGSRAAPLSAQGIVSPSGECPSGGIGRRTWLRPRHPSGYPSSTLGAGTQHAFVAQWTERPSSTRLVRGSNPRGGTVESRRPRHTKRGESFVMEATGRPSAAALAQWDGSPASARVGRHADEAQRQGVCLPCRRTRVRLPSSARGAAALSLPAGVTGNTSDSESEECRFETCAGSA